MKKIYATIVLYILFVSLFASIVSANNSQNENIADAIPIDKGLKIRSNHFPIVGDPIDLLDMGPSIGVDWTVGDTANWFALDEYYGSYFFDEFTCRAENSVAQVWVQNDLSWVPGDPRNLPIITDVQSNYILNEFTNNILPTEIQYFGTPYYRDGSYSWLDVVWGDVPPSYYVDSTGRYIILVSNIRDENYYDSSYPYYIAGFFSPDFVYYFDRNIISIDCYEWDQRLGDPNYVYEGVVAHEFQHLIHNDIDPDEDTWINEGCSMYAETLCGYGFQESVSNHFFFTPDNSLTIWGDQGDINILADYGQAYLFMMYLNDHYGGAFFISELANNLLNGIEGIQDTLYNRGYNISFRELFHNWTIANLLRNGDGAYNYNSFDMSLLDQVNIHNAPNEKFRGIELGETITLEGYQTGIFELCPWGTDYIKIDSTFPADLLQLWFDGQDMPGHLWQLANYDTMYGTATGHSSTFWSGTLNLTDNVIAMELNLVDTISPELTFGSYYNIEEGWDYGFVQVSLDNGVTWQSLSNEHTQIIPNPNLHPDIFSNLPGFTGSNIMWTEETFDLSEYNGEIILLSFRYMTDWYTTYDGWFIDDISVDDGSKNIFFDSCDDLSNWIGSDIIFGHDVDFDITYISNSYGTIVPLYVNDKNELGNLSGNLGENGGVLIINYIPSHNQQTKVDYDVNYIIRQSSGAATSTFPLYINVLKSINTTQKLTLEKMLEAENEGKNMDHYDSIMGEVNLHIANSSKGVNWIYKANELNIAMKLLLQILQS